MVNTDTPESSSRAERILILSGFGCLLLTMVLGFIYANYISHVANAGIKESWAGVMVAVTEGDVEMLRQHFTVISDLTAKRGRIMNSHSHLGACGLLALLLAVLLPLSRLSDRIKQMLAWSILFGALLQFVSVLASYYFNKNLIFLADIGALFLFTGVAITLWGFYGQSKQVPSIADYITARLEYASSRLLLKAGSLLLLLGMLLGLYLAWLIVSGEESQSLASVLQSAEHLMQKDTAAAQSAIKQFKALQTKMSINAASHSHGLEMAFLMLLLALLRPLINIKEAHFKIWCFGFIGLSYVFPLWIFLAINYWFGFAKFANFTGLTLACLLLFVAYGVAFCRDNEPAEQKPGS